MTNFRALLRGAFALTAWALFACWAAFPQPVAAQTALDPTFGTGGLATFDFGGAYDDVEGISIAPNGKIWAVGTGGTSNRFGVARLLPSGQLDTSFSGDGKLIISGSAGAGGVQGLSDGKVLLGVPRLTPEPRGFQTIRLNDSGSFDSTFGVGGVGFIETNSQVNIEDLLVLPDNKVLVGGYDFFADGWNFVLTRFLANGSPDPAFGVGGRVITDFSRPAIQNPTDRAEEFILQPDGKILAGGFSATTAAESTGNRIHAIARYLPDGTLDPTFGDQGRKTFTFALGSTQQELVGALAVLPDGKILGTSNGGSDTALFRLNSDGSLDPTFGTGGRIIAPTGAPWRDPSSLLLDSQGRILVGNGSSFSVTRFLPSGVVDSTFVAGGTFDVDVGTTRYEVVSDMEFDAAGDLVIGGYSNVTANVDSNWHVARIKLTTPSPTRTITLAPTFDVKAIPGAVRSITDGETTLYIGLGFDAQSPEERPIFEFPLAGIPKNATITSATLKLDPNASSGSPRIEAVAYAGDGLASISDITIPGTVAATSGPVSAALDSIELNLNAGVVQSLLAEATHLGLRLRSVDVPLYVGVRSSESTFGVPPQLSVTFTLPTHAADFNNDGRVDNLDLAKWKSDFGVNHLSDANDDNVTDGADFLAWQREYGSGIVSAAAIPEPTGGALIASAALAFFAPLNARRRPANRGVPA